MFLVWLFYVQLVVSGESPKEVEKVSGLVGGTVKVNRIIFIFLFNL